MIGILMVFCFANASSYENKEETCLTLASRGVQERAGEITDFLLEKPLFLKKDLANKLTEDAYDLCMSLITIQEIKKLQGISQKPYAWYSHLVNAPLHYKTQADLQVTSNFADYRIEISKRIAMKSISLDRDL